MNHYYRSTFYGRVSCGISKLISYQFTTYIVYEPQTLENR